MTFLLHHLLTQSAERRPEAPAVRLGDAILSYGELEDRTNRLALALAAAGVRRGDRVGIHLPKCIETVVGVFAILKAGASYVPLDFGAPAARIADIGNQCGLRCIVSCFEAAEKLGRALANLPTVTHVFFSDRAPDAPLGAASAVPFERVFAEHAGSAPDVGAVDHDLAYILFTSGSTGKPKGVMLSHLNSLTFVNWARETFRLTPADRVSNHAPLSFDLSTFDIFAGIGAGACVSIIPDGLGLFPFRLAELIEQHGITVWYSVPSVLVSLLEKGRMEERRLDAWRLVLFAGEVFPIRYLRDLQRALPGRRMANLYGPTETNVCTWYDVPPIPPEQTASIPIGKACANTDVFALDANGKKITAPGQEGLLYARGSIVMQGYFGRPEETAKSFIENPLTPWRGERLYCTGDWVTLDDAGNYQFIGRRDHMIKVRGYRVELGEIEATLYTHPGVREAAVVAVPDPDSGNRIKAFVVPLEAGALSEIEVKRHCARTLPKYMVPEEVELRSSLPRTATDKVDRPALIASSTSK